SWYSSMLLLSVAVLAMLCYWTDSQSPSSVSRHKFLAKGWLVIAAFFAFLSFDELGSLHENAGKVRSLDVMKDQSWESVLLVPGLLIVIYMGFFAWVHL